MDSDSANSEMESSTEVVDDSSATARKDKNKNNGVVDEDNLDPFQVNEAEIMEMDSITGPDLVDLDSSNEQQQQQPAEDYMFQCMHCPESFETKEEAQGHVEDRHDRKKVNIHDSRDKDRDRSSRRSSAPKLPKKSKKQFHCLHCKKSFHTIHVLQNHSKLIHGRGNSDPTLQTTNLNTKTNTKPWPNSSCLAISRSTYQFFVRSPMSMQPCLERFKQTTSKRRLIRRLLVQKSKLARLKSSMKTKTKTKIPTKAKSKSKPSSSIRHSSSGVGVGAKKPTKSEAGVGDSFCVPCNRQYTSLFHLTRHELTKSHREITNPGLINGNGNSNSKSNTDKDKEAALNYCFSCDKSFQKSSHLIRHYDTLSHREQEAKVSTSHVQKEEAAVSNDRRELKRRFLKATPTKSKSPESSKAELHRCVTCNISYRTVIDLNRHYSTSKHTNKVQGSSSSTPEPKTKTKAGSKFDCEACGTSYSSISHLERHYTTIGHQEKLKQANWAYADTDYNASTPTKSKSTPTPASSSKKRYDCTTCGTYYGSYTHLKRHYATLLHLSKLETGTPAAAAGDEDEEHFVWEPEIPNMPSANFEPPSPKLFACVKCNTTYASSDKLKRHYKTGLHLSKMDSDVNDYLDEDADDDVPDDDGNLASITSLLYPEVSSTSSPRISGRSGKKVYDCRSCNTYYGSSTHLKRHCLTALHLSKLQEMGENGDGHGVLAAPAPPVVIKPDPDVAVPAVRRHKCETCDSFYSSAKELKRHTLTAKHLTKLDQDHFGHSSSNSKSSTTTTTTHQALEQGEEAEDWPRQKSSRKYKCEPCDLAFKKASHLERHCTTESHRNNLRVFLGDDDDEDGDDG